MGFDDEGDDNFELYQRCLAKSVMNDMLAGNKEISEFINVCNYSGSTSWNGFDSFDTTLVELEKVVDTREPSFVTAVPPRPDDFYPSLDDFYPNPNDFYPSLDDFYPNPKDFYPSLDETLTEDVLKGLANFDIDLPSSSTSGTGNYHHFEFDTPFGPSEYEADESFFEDFLAGLSDNIDVDSSLIESIFGYGVKDGGDKRGRSSGNWSSDLGSTYLEGNTNDNKLYGKGWEDESLIDDILRSGGNDYVTSSLLDALFKYDENDGIYVDSVSSKRDDDDDDLKSFDKDEKKDFYMLHRKDALEAIRSASRHSKAAEEASKKGDDASASQYKLKAKEDLARAKKLNAEAAERILSIKNRDNDLWTLDLHGLHREEAVDAVRRRLEFIESHKRDELGKHKKICLRAITGRGNHSKGAPVLPSAVRKFLTKNGYKFNDSRPGSFMIQPKIRAE